MSLVCCSFFLLGQMSRREETSVAARSTAIKRPAEEEEGEDGGEEVEEPKKKISFGLGKPKGMMSVGLTQQPAKKPLGGISIKLGQTQKAAAQPGIKPKVGAAAAVFNAEDDDDSEEEMPPEAKMRMKNIGRDTPTSAGPNSFGKTRMGFCDSKKIYEKQLKEIQEKTSRGDPLAPQQNNGDHSSDD